MPDTPITTMQEVRAAITAFNSDERDRKEAAAAALATAPVTTPPVPVPGTFGDRAAEIQGEAELLRAAEEAHRALVADARLVLAASGRPMPEDADPEQVFFRAGLRDDPQMTPQERAWEERRQKVLADPKLPLREAVRREWYELAEADRQARCLEAGIDFAAETQRRDATGRSWL